MPVVPSLPIIEIVPLSPQSLLVDTGRAPVVLFLRTTSRFSGYGVLCRYSPIRRMWGSLAMQPDSADMGLFGDTARFSGYLVLRQYSPIHLV
jgi:hypothetical protein